MKLLLTLLLSFQLLAAENATMVKKGDEVPFTGVLLSVEKTIELEKAQRKAVALEDLRIVQEDMIKFHQDNAKAYRKKLSAAKFDTFLSNTGYFALGVVLASFAFKVSGKIGDI